jgi:hypothetical protein
MGMREYMVRSIRGGVLVVIIIVTACGGSSETATTGPSTPAATPTQSPTQALEQRATPLCTAAFAAPAPSAAMPAMRPVVLYWRRDESQVQASSRSSTAGPGWLGEIYGDLPEAVKARTVEEVKTVVCRQEHYIQVGTYQMSQSAAVRIDWELRLVRWPTGETLAARTFRGGDPPASRTTMGHLSWEHGPRPEAEAKAWLEQTLRPGP